MARVKARREPAPHLLVSAGIGLDEIRFAFEVGNADILADGGPQSRQFRKRGGKRLDAEPAPAHALLEEQRVRESLAVISPDVDEDAVALSFEEVLQQKAVLAALRVE